MTIDVAAEARIAALYALAQQTRDLMDAVTVTGVDEDELVSVTAELAALTDRLGAVVRASRQPFDIAPDGSLRHMGNAAIGGANPYAVPLVVEQNPDGGVRAEVTFRRLHEGPPGGVHGGISAMALDHLLGQAAAAVGLAGVTATLTVRYKAPVPYGRPVIVTAEQTRSEGRKTWAEGRVSLPDGTVLVEATGLFITPSGWLNGRLPNLPA
jgi:acyl-coenzyme A thioesterase PaaI-like protein